MKKKLFVVFLVLSCLVLIASCDVFPGASYNGIPSWIANKTWKGTVTTTFLGASETGETELTFDDKGIVGLPENAVASYVTKGKVLSVTVKMSETSDDITINTVTEMTFTKISDNECKFESTSTSSGAILSVTIEMVGNLKAQ